MNTSTTTAAHPITMKAAVIPAPALPPIYTDFRDPVAGFGEELITLHASALSHLSKARASGTHYSSNAAFPSVPGVDGVGTTADGRRVYFVMPEAPFGALAEKSLVRAAQCIPIPDTLDDVTAAALANPGMSAWASLVERAHLLPGETVLVHGATGTAGRIAVQLAKHLGADKVIATGRNPAELDQLRSLGADILLPFDLQQAGGADAFTEALEQEFAHGIHIVVDYLWGESARAIIVAIAKAVEDATPVRFIQVGTAAGDPNLSLPGAALRSSAIVLMGSGLKSVPLQTLLHSIGNVFEVARSANLQIATATAPLASIADHWENAAGRPRLVFLMP